MDSGSCVEWADEVWLVANEEHNSVQSHRTYVMKRCQTELNLLLHGETWSFPCIINNLNIYSDGSKENVNITTSSAKYQVMIPQNIITDCIKLQSRIAIGNRIYEVSLIDKLTNKNIYTLVAVEVVANSLDDLDNNVAYDDEMSKPEDIVYWDKIQGSDIIYLGETAEFLCEDAISWNVQYDRKWCNIILNEEKVLKIECSTKNEYVGKSIVIQALDINGNVIDEKIINVRGYF